MDHLQCLGHVGTGATAYVFKAQGADGKVCAVKTRKLATDATSTKQADNAAMDGEFLRTLSGHPNIVKWHTTIAAPLPDGFLDFIPEVDQAPFRKTTRAGIRRSVDCYVMDYHAHNVFVAVDQERQTDEPYTRVIVGILQGLLSASEHMLSTGVLHLDLKADNVLADAQGKPVVIDFSHCCTYDSAQDCAIVPTGSIGNDLHRALISTNSTGLSTFWATWQSKDSRVPLSGRGGS